MYGSYGNGCIPAYDENYSQATEFPPKNTPFHGPQSTSNRPTAKAIYQQRKAYAQKLNSTDSPIQHRVEHLITCDHDLNDGSIVDHCIQHLRKLDAEGKVWGQDMFLQLSNTSFKLVDIETKDDLENFPIDAVKDSQAVLNSCIYNSILAVTISSVRSSIFLFQCEEVSADLIQNDMEKIIKRKKERRNHDVLRNTSGIVNSQSPQEPYLKPPIQTAPPNCNNIVEPAASDHQSSIEQSSRTSSETDSMFNNNQAALDTERLKKILNHVIDEIEIFLIKIQKSIDSNPQKKKKKKSKKMKEILPPETEYIDCFQKIKYAFNLLTRLESQLDKSSAANIVHSIFQSIQFILENIPRKDLAKDVIVPFLIPDAITFLASVTTPKEEQIWKSLGDAWKIPRSEWPNGESLEENSPTFLDTWDLPQKPLQQHPSNEQQLPAKKMGGRSWQEREPLERSQKFAKIKYDFKKRNLQELTVTAGDVLEVLETSKQWCKVKDRNGSIGHVPHNILQFMDQDEAVSLYNGIDCGDQYFPKAHSPLLTKLSKPTEVAAWLQDKGFSSKTVKTLGILSGSQLLSLTEEELKMVSASEGRIVYDKIHRSQSTAPARMIDY
ncbi:epidermal growth factor receptor kinase substrate 8-like protein 3 [Narcine bancroftii]|uniref:epidermal growth factor receptor kinase substrate 8-like protein 3 n=1 Tax=Narcine bancroftii TaxID=1343680 RepID=UPI003831A5E0